MSDAEQVPFGSNLVRLSPREWLVAGWIVGVVLLVLPLLWPSVEAVATRRYRIPYRLSSDYWVLSRYRARAWTGDTLVVGDSVVWGHYVGRLQTLSGALNLSDPLGDRPGGIRGYLNLGVDGIHPAALEGLVRHYGKGIADTKVILHCNLLWMSSKRHDLQLRKEFAFNHPRLVPQFWPRIPCYAASFEERLGIAIGRVVPFMSWADHLRIAYFDGRDIPSWTLDHPYSNPVRNLARDLPSPDEPPSPKPDARPWTEKGVLPFDAKWVGLETSFQWAAFRRTVELLERRRNRVFVLVGPFNEHMLTDQSRAVYQERKRQVEAWLQANGTPCFVPPPLPSELYADASHPLADGYALLAEELLENPAFRRFTDEP